MPFSPQGILPLSTLVVSLLAVGCIGLPGNVQPDFDTTHGWTTVIEDRDVDKQIRRAVIDSLRSNRLQISGLKVDCFQQLVSLRGTVANEQTRSRAGQLAKKAMGVYRLANLLDVDPRIGQPAASQPNAAATAGSPSAAEQLGLFETSPSGASAPPAAPKPSP